MTGMISKEIEEYLKRKGDRCGICGEESSWLRIFKHDDKDTKYYLCDRHCSSYLSYEKLKKVVVNARSRKKY